MEDVNEILSTTSTTLANLLRHKNGGDALALYFRYQMQSRIQDNNVTFSKDTFMAKAMGWGVERMSKAKKVLMDEGMIDPVVRRDEEGKITGHYMRVCFALKTNHSTGTPTSGLSPQVDETATNTKEKKEINTKEKKNKGERVPHVYISSIIISIKKGVEKWEFSYSNVKERQFANLLTKNKEWRETIASSGVSEQDLIALIMDWSNQDTFWRGRITSVMTFYYKWTMLINQMKAHGEFKQVDKEKDEARQKAAELFYNSI